MADIRTKLCGIEIDSPFVLASGPPGFSAEGLVAAAAAGAGAVVTKTITYNGIHNTTQHMARPANKTLINNEGGSDLPLEYWFEELPKAKAGGVKCLIASIGDVDIDSCIDIGKQVLNHGADILEIVVDYHNAGDLVAQFKKVRSAIHAPLLVKVNANWKNTNEIADLCAQAGADGITAIDSMGPVFRVDLSTGRPMLGGNGYGYITGAPILPFALRIVNEIASGSHSFMDIVGTGGVTSGRDALEMLMAGATSVGVCTMPTINGPGAFTKLCKELSDALDKYGYSSISEAQGIAVQKELLPTKTPDDFCFDLSQCNHCGRCEVGCPYRARTLGETTNHVDPELCRVCGLCFTLCPTQAITIK